MRVEQYRRMNVAREGAREKTMGDGEYGRLVGTVMTDADIDRVR